MKSTVSTVPPLSSRTAEHEIQACDAGGGPLSGITVIDLSRALAGPHAAMMLGDLGARVIKVETPRTGDESRTWGTQVGPEGAEESVYFLACNRNKESVTANLKSAEGKALLWTLAGRADVIVENFRPGVMDRLGFSNEQLHLLNPRLVILSISGFGHDGPQAGRAGYDQIAQGEAGLMSLTGPDAEHPLRVGVPIADVLAGMNGAYGVLAALMARECSGKGDVVRTSLLSSVVAVHAFHGTAWTVAGEIGHGTGNKHAVIAPYGMFHCKNGAIQVAVASERLWQSFCEVLGLEAATPEFATNNLRFAHAVELTRTIEDALARGTPAEWLARLDSAGIPCGQVRTLDQVYCDEQTRSQGLVLSLKHQTLGAIEIPGPAVRFEEHARDEHVPPPTLGAHNESVRSWLRHSLATDGLQS
jgi:crotonobetainyl-CoA:carnitine CoA-transferase CaiB-like acyl-CoA transferase